MEKLLKALSKVITAVSWDDQLRKWAKEGKKLDKKFEIRLLKDYDPGIVFPSVFWKGEEYSESDLPKDAPKLLRDIMKFVDKKAEKIWMDIDGDMIIK